MTCGPSTGSTSRCGPGAHRFRRGERRRQDDDDADDHGHARPDAGEVLWDGRPMTAADRRRFGYMPEERGLYPKQKVARPARLPRPAHGMTTGPPATAVDEPPRAVRPGDRAGDRVRSAQPRQPAARADRRGPAPRPGGPGARRAVQRARPGRGRRDGRHPARPRGIRGAGAVQLPPARPRGAALRPPHRAGPRPGRRAGRGRRPARAAGRPASAW